MEDQLNKIRLWFTSYMANRGYKQAEGKDSPEAFGSWYIICKKNSHLIRLVWNGKDFEVVLEGSEVGTSASMSWKNIASYRIKPNIAAPAIKEIESVLEKNIL